MQFPPTIVSMPPGYFALSHRKQSHKMLSCLPCKPDTRAFGGTWDVESRYDSASQRKSWSENFLGGLANALRGDEETGDPRWPPVEQMAVVSEVAAILSGGRDSVRDGESNDLLQDFDWHEGEVGFWFVLGKTVRQRRLPSGRRDEALLTHSGAEMT